MASSTYKKGYVDTLLKQNTTEKFYMELMEYRSNHLAHGLVALDRLQAPKARLEQFLQWYQERLEKPDGETAKEQSTTETDPSKLLGARKGYYALVNYYEYRLNEDYSADVDQLIRGEFPKLQRGMIGAALHGLLQTGYAYAGKFSRGVCEGLAYMHHSYVPIKLTKDQLYLGKGDTDIVDVLDKIRKDKHLQDYVRSEEVASLPDPHPFTNRCNALVTHKGNMLANYVRQIETPKIDLATCTMQDVKTICRWLLNCAILVYTKSEIKNDFFLLHGVTGTWSLLQILNAIEDPLQGLEALQSLVISYLVDYLAQDSPPLTQAIDPSAFKFKEWDDIVKAVIDRQDLDEHGIKLVQVVHDLAMETDEEEETVLYKAAANSALMNEFFFSNYD